VHAYHLFPPKKKGRRKVVFPQVGFGREKRKGRGGKKRKKYPVPTADPLKEWEGKKGGTSSNEPIVPLDRGRERGKRKKKQTTEERKKEG